MVRGPAIAEPGVPAETEQEAVHAVGGGAGQRAVGGPRADPGDTDGLCASACAGNPVRRSGEGPIISSNANVSSIRGRRSSYMRQGYLPQRIEGRVNVHHLAPGVTVVFSLLAHRRMIGHWVRDRSRQRLNCAVLRELAHTGGTIREEHRSRGGTLVWEVKLPPNKPVPDPRTQTTRQIGRVGLGPRCAAPAPQGHRGVVLAPANRAAAGDRREFTRGGQQRFQGPVR